MANSVYVIELWHHCHPSLSLSCNLCMGILASSMMAATSYLVWILPYFAHKCTSSYLGMCHILAFEGHICCWHIFCSSIVNVVVYWFLLHVCIYGIHMRATVEVQWDIHMQYGRYNCSEAYVSNVECVHTSVPGHIVDCSEFIWSIYNGIVVTYQLSHDVIGICGIWGGIFVTGTYMLITW